MRRALASAVAVAAGAVLAGLAVAAPPAAAAPAPVVVVAPEDPFATDPVSVRIAAADADGTAAAFRGTVALSVGSTRSTVPVSAGEEGVAVVAVPTRALKQGRATLKAVLRVGGRRVTVVREGFAELTASFAVRGFSCSVVRPGGGAVRWAVGALQGAPVRTPNARDVPLLPYVPSSAARWRMSGPDGLPLATSGTMTIESGGRVLARRALPRAVRRLVFGVRWDGRTAGAVRPGTVTARLVLRDPAGRTAVATQPVAVVASGPGPCSG